MQKRIVPAPKFQPKIVPPTKVQWRGAPPTVVHQKKASEMPDVSKKQTPAPLPTVAPASSKAAPDDTVTIDDDAKDDFEAAVCDAIDAGDKETTAEGGDGHASDVDFDEDSYNPVAVCQIISNPNGVIAALFAKGPVACRICKEGGVQDDFMNAGNSRYPQPRHKKCHSAARRLDNSVLEPPDSFDEESAETVKARKKSLRDLKSNPDLYAVKVLELIRTHVENTCQREKCLQMLEEYAVYTGVKQRKIATPLDPDELYAYLKYTKGLDKAAARAKAKAMFDDKDETFIEEDGVNKIMVRVPNQFMLDKGAVWSRKQQRDHGTVKDEAGLQRQMKMLEAAGKQEAIGSRFDKFGSRFFYSAEYKREYEEQKKRKREEVAGDDQDDDAESEVGDDMTAVGSADGRSVRRKRGESDSAAFKRRQELVLMKNKALADTREIVKEFDNASKAFEKFVRVKKYTDLDEEKQEQIGVAGATQQFDDMKACVVSSADLLRPKLGDEIEQFLRELTLRQKAARELLATLDMVLRNFRTDLDRIVKDSKPVQQFVHGLGKKDNRATKLAETGFARKLVRVAQPVLSEAEGTDARADGDWAPAMRVCKMPDDSELAKKLGDLLEDIDDRVIAVNDKLTSKVAGKPVSGGLLCLANVANKLGQPYDKSALLQALFPDVKTPLELTDSVGAGWIVVVNPRQTMFGPMYSPLEGMPRVIKAQEKNVLVTALLMSEVKVDFDMMASLQAMAPQKINGLIESKMLTVTLLKENQIMYCPPGMAVAFSAPDAMCSVLVQPLLNLDALKVICSDQLSHMDSIFELAHASAAVAVSKGFFASIKSLMSWCKAMAPQVFASE